VVPAEAVGGRSVVGPDPGAGGSGPSRRHLAVLVVIVAGSSGLVFALGRVTGFILTDFRSFADARALGLSSELLLTPVAGHFVPGHRFVNWLAYSLAPMSLTFTSLYLAVVLALTLVLLHRTLVELLGPGGPALAALAFFAASTVQVGTSLWWAAGLSRMTANLFVVAALLAYLLHRRPGPRSRRHRWGWLAASVAATALALAFAEDGMLVLPILLALRVLVLDPEVPVTTNLGRAAREWRTWLGYLVPMGLAYLGSASQTSTLSAIHSPALLGEYLVLGWTRLFAPTLVGQYVDVGPLSAGEVVVVVGAQVAVAAAVVVTVRRRPAAARAWAFLGVGYLLTEVPIGLLRTGSFGTALLAQSHRYYSVTMVVATIALGAAVFGVPGGTGLGRPWTGRAASGRIPGGDPRRRPGPAVVAGAVVAAAAYLGGSVASSVRLTATWPGVPARTWLEGVDAGIEALEAAGTGYTLVDLSVPDYVVPPFLFGLDRLSDVVPLLHPEVELSSRSPAPYRVVGPEGALVPVEVEVAAGGDARTLLGTGRLVTTPARGTGPSGRSGPAGGAPQVRGGGVCFAGAEPGAGAGAILTVVPPLPERRWYLRLVYEPDGVGDGTGVAAVAVDPGTGYRGAEEPAAALGDGEREAVVALGTTPVARVAVGFPQPAPVCLTEVAVIALRPADP